MAKTPEERREYIREYMRQNSWRYRESQKQRRLEKHLANPEIERERSRAYRKKNPEKIKQLYKDWRAKNLDHLRRSNIAYRSKPENRIRLIIANAIRSAKKLGLPFDEQLYELYRNNPPPTVCECCGRELNYSLSIEDNRKRRDDCPSIDKIVPEKGYILGNTAIICWRCNFLKRDGSLYEISAIAFYMAAKLREKMSMKRNIFDTNAENTTPGAEQVTIDVYKGIGNPGEAGPHRTQKDVTVPNDVVHKPMGTTRM